MRALSGALLALALAAPTGLAQESTWPRKIERRTLDIYVHQPQLESYANGELQARAVIVVKKWDEPDQAFGTMWFKARAVIDEEKQLVRCFKVEVERLKFPLLPQSKEDSRAAMLQEEMRDWKADISLDYFESMLRTLKADAAEQQLVSDAPPRILHAMRPTVLVTLDAAPELRPAGDGLSRVVNTPFFVVRDADRFYVKAGPGWRSAAAIEGPWVAEDVPAAVAAAAKDEFDAAPSGPVPEVVVSTEPAELVLTDGEPDFQPLEGTDLELLANSRTDALREKATGAVYVLLSGRWYRSEDIKTGTWTHVAPGDLPAEFGRIRDNSPGARIFSHLPGRAESRALIDRATMARTAVVSRKDATCDVVFDGEADFADATEGMSYARNSNIPVVKFGERLFACDDAIWFEAGSPDGPWAVCAAEAAQIEAIPPTVPVHELRYVFVFGATEDRVNVGYTPEYLGLHVRDGLVVFGTGIHYAGFTGERYHPGPRTWGFSARYDTSEKRWFLSVGDEKDPGAWIPKSAREAGWFGPAGFRAFSKDASRNVYAKRKGVMTSYSGDETAAELAKMPMVRTGDAFSMQDPMFANKNGDTFRLRHGGWQTYRENRWRYGYGYGYGGLRAMTRGYIGLSLFRR